MAKFIYEVRVKAGGKVVAQYIFRGLRDACVKARSAVQELSGCNADDVVEGGEELWLKSFHCAGYYAFLYRNIDGNNILA